MSIITVGIDLAKDIFAVHGVNASGKAELIKPRVARGQHELDLVRFERRYRNETVGLDSLHHKTKGSAQAKATKRGQRYHEQPRMLLSPCRLRDRVARQCRVRACCTLATNAMTRSAYFY